MEDEGGNEREKEREVEKEAQRRDLRSVANYLL